MSSLDSHVVQAVAEALAKADWTDNRYSQLWTWDVLDQDERDTRTTDQLRAARVAVAAMEAATEMRAA